MKDISVDELKHRLQQNEDIYLLDVREPFEHEEFNISGKLIPLGELPSRFDELEHLKNTEIVVYCRSGKRSATARDFLIQQGFTQVRNLEGGMLRWIHD